MNISELIKLIEEAKETYGDLNVMVDHGKETPCPEITEVRHYPNYIPDTLLITEEYE